MKKITPLLTVALMLSVAINSMFVTGMMDDEVVDGLSVGTDGRIDDICHDNTNDDVLVYEEMQEKWNKYEDSAWWGSTRITDYRLGADWLALPNEGNITWGADADFEARYNSTSDELEWTGGNQIFDGNITAGNITATGDIIAENVFTHSYLFAHTDNNITVDVSGTWYNITFNETESLKSGILHNYDDGTNDTFTIVDDGIYELHGHVSFQDSAITPSSNIIFRFTRNDVEIPGSIREYDLDKKDWDTLGSTTVFASLTAGDEIKFQFTSDDTTVSLESDHTYGVHKDTAVAKIKRIA